MTTVAETKRDYHWRHKAREMLPELSGQTRKARRPMAFWNEVWDLFERAYRYPRNDDLIDRIYRFADWCMDEAPRNKDAGWDMFTCVVVCFWEHIATVPAARADMPLRFSREEVEEAPEVFGYMLADGEFEKVLAVYDAFERERAAQG